MKYQIFPINKPQLHELVWIINPIAKEVLAYYMGSSSFFSYADNSKHGFYAKYWRPTEEIEKTFPDWNPKQPETKPKRKYTKRKKK